MKPKIIFAIITYHPNPHQLKKLLAVLKPYQVLIVDNTKNNLGYAGGANKAIQQGLKQNADWIIILNQDLTITPAFLQKFISLLLVSKPAILGPFAGTFDKKRWTTILTTTPSCHSRVYPVRENGNLFKWIPASAGMTRYISGSFIVIHKKVIEEIGNFYQPYFMYYEDADYCVRSQKAGFPLIKIFSMGIYHNDTSSLGRGSFAHEYYLARNHLLFIKKNAPVAVKLHEVLHFPKTIYEHLKNKNSGALRGILDFFLNKFDVKITANMKLSLKQTLLILFLILTPLFLSLLPFFIQSYKSPPDRVFTGLHRWSEDYYGYLQSINQGLMGHITNVSKLTNQPHQPTFVHSEYVFLGFVGRFFGLNSTLTYHLSRLFLGAIFVFVSFYFFYFSCPPKLYAKGGRPLRFAIIAFFLAFFVGGFPRLSLSLISHFPYLISSIEAYLPWWNELDVLRRSTILPHYLMGSIFFLLIIILFLKLLYSVILGNPAQRGDSRIDSGQARMTRYYLLLTVLFSFLLAFVHPIDFLILLCSLGLFVMLMVFGNLNFKHLNLFRIADFGFRIFHSILSTKYQILLLLLIFISGLIPVLYYRYALSLPFWRFILAHGTTTPYNIPLFDLSLALGPVFFLALLYLSLRGIRLWRMTKQSSSLEKRLPRTKKFDEFFSTRNDNVPLLLFSWLFVQTLFFLKLYQVFNFDRLRTMEAPFYIPLAFFATYLIMSLRGVPLSGTTKQSSLLMRLPRTKNLSQIFSARNDTILILLVFLVTLPTTIINLRNQIYSLSDFKTFSLFSYPTIKQYQSWEFLRKNTPDNSVITTLYEAKFLLPTVSGNKIAFGANFDNDPNYQNSVNAINKMYAGLLTSQDAQKFLNTNHIKYVYWGYQEQSLGGDLTKYHFLQKIFNNGEVTVFEVK